MPKTSVPNVTASTARRLFLGAQGLLDDPTRRATPAVTRRLVHKLGYVQVDSINVIERAHHLILASRLDGYEPRMLHRDRGELQVRGLWWEPGVRPTRTRMSALRSALGRLARFTGAEGISLPRAHRHLLDSA